MFIHHEVWKYYNQLDSEDPNIKALLAPFFAGGSAYIGYSMFPLRKLSASMIRGKAEVFEHAFRTMRFDEMRIFQKMYPKASLAATRKAWVSSSLHAAGYAEEFAGIGAQRALRRRAIGKGLSRLVPYLGWAMLAYDAYTVVRHGTFWGVDVPGVPEGGWL
jgi:hypothetical protein